MKNSVEIHLLGQKIALKSAGDPALVQEVVDLVSQKITSAESRSREKVPHHVALLALLDLAENYVEAKRRLRTHQEAFDEKSRQLLALLEGGKDV